MGPLALSTRAQAALDSSLEMALRQTAGSWSPLYLLAVLTDEGYRELQELATAFRLDVLELRARLKKRMEEKAGDPSQRVPTLASPSRAEEDIRRLITTATEEARLSHAPAVGVEHLLLALAEGESEATCFLGDLGITYARLRNHFDPLQRRIRRWELPFSTYRNLSALGRDLTELARHGELDPVVGRETEINRVMQILARRLKNNPILVGYAGVGKTAIVEGLAQRIAAGQVPDAMRYKRIVSLDLSALVAGTRVRGQLEERLQGIIQDIERAEQDIILFIDEIHMIVGAGASEGGFDFAAMIKSALGRGELRVIGSTTPDEYRRYVERDTALERRFSPVWVAEPTPSESLLILHGLRDRYQLHHQVRITDDAITAAVRLSVRYLRGRYLPDKAIDLIDEAAARVVLDRGAMPADLKEVRDRVYEPDIDADKGSVDTDSKVWREYRQQMLAWLETNEANRVVTENDVASVLSSMTGIPVGRAIEHESDRLINLEKLLHRRVIGQNRAIELVSSAIRRARAGLSDPRRPIGSFIFLGPSGVGKTELARALAEALFDDIDALVRLDMSEYMERHNVARLVGAPPGYVGYEDGGTLTELVRRRPYRVILFDEIEKAHPDVFNILLQILDDGRLTDGHGRVVDFRNTVLIMTSNLGSSDECDAHRLLPGADGAYDREWLEEQVTHALRSTFRPEFRNRIDEIVVFEPLSQRQLFQILELRLSEARAALALRGVSLRVTTSARRALVREGFHPVFGARPLARTVQSRILTPLASRLLRDRLGTGDTVTVGYGRSGYTFRVQRGGATHVPKPARPPLGGRFDGAPSMPVIWRGTLESREVPWLEDSATYFI